MHVIEAKGASIPHTSRVKRLSENMAIFDFKLSPEEMAEIETRLRADKQLAAKLRAIHGRRDAGVHSLGEIWRRHRISCPSREQLGSYLLGVADEAVVEYVDFHLQHVGCRFCEANLGDLRQRQEETGETARRRQRYFQSSAGYLRGRSRDKKDGD